MCNSCPIQPGNPLRTLTVGAAHRDSGRTGNSRNQCAIMKLIVSVSGHTSHAPVP